MRGCPAKRGQNRREGRPPPLAPSYRHPAPRAQGQVKSKDADGHPSSAHILGLSWDTPLLGLLEFSLPSETHVCLLSKAFLYYSHPHGHQS